MYKITHTRTCHCIHLFIVYRINAYFYASLKQFSVILNEKTELINACNHCDKLKHLIVLLSDRSCLCSKYTC